MIFGKKSILIIFILIIGVSLLIFIMYKNSNPCITSITSFDVNDYQYYIENFSSDENVGSIFDVKDVIVKTESIWIKMYGENVKKEKPFQIFYDTENDTWLIKGSLRKNMTGGVANILIENHTGKVLAVWHDK